MQYLENICVYWDIKLLESQMFTISEVANIKIEESNNN